MVKAPFYDKEIAALAAQESGLDREFISDVNENSTDRLHSLYLSTRVVQQAIRAQDKILHKIAENGACVIVGRAADHVLKDCPDVVRIFIHAPEDYRIRRICEVYGDSPAEAKKQLRRSDDVRAAYYKTVSGQDWGKRENYELCLDSSIGVEQTANVLCAYLENR